MTTTTPYYNEEQRERSSRSRSRKKGYDSGDGLWRKGKKQPRKCQDVVWAFLFYLHLGAILAVTIKFAPTMAQDLAEEYAGGAQRRLTMLSIRRFLPGDDEDGNQDQGGEDEQADGQDEDAAADADADADAEDANNQGEDYADGQQDGDGDAADGQDEGNDGQEDGQVQENNAVDQEGYQYRYTGGNNNQGDDSGENSGSWTTIAGLELDLAPMTRFFILLVSGGLAGMILSSICLGVLQSYSTSRGLIRTCLIFNVVATAGVAINSNIQGYPAAAVLALIGFLVSAYYAYVVWGRISFASANLNTASTVIQRNIGLAFFAFTNLFASFLWSIWWAAACFSTLFMLGGCDINANCENGIDGFVFFLFLVSYFWTSQILKNVVHVMVAGTVATWWFNPTEGSGCCSKGVRDSYFRSMTTSFGSICLGSLFVSIVESLRGLIQTCRDHDDNFMVAFFECFLGCWENLLEYFNKWAFTYVGIYGYSFMDAGINVTALFRARGWTTITNDILVDTVLLMVTLGVSVLTGIISYFVAYFFLVEEDVLEAAFIVGALIGFMMSSSMLSLVSSAVNATIVLYAEAPSEFERNHHDLSVHMKEAWREGYPGEFAY